MSVIPKVVLADDESHIRMMMKIVLSRVGFEVVGEAANGRDALELCRRLDPDMVLLDINMPALNGDEALAAILDANPAIAVVMLTSVSDSGTVERCLELGAANYLRKDTPVQEIAGVLQRTWKEWEELRGGGA